MHSQKPKQKAKLDANETFTSECINFHVFSFVMKALLAKPTHLVASGCPYGGDKLPSYPRGSGLCSNRIVFGEILTIQQRRESNLNFLIRIVCNFEEKLEGLWFL